MLKIDSSSHPNKQNWITVESFETYITYYFYCHTVNTIIKANNKIIIMITIILKHQKITK